MDHPFTSLKILGILDHKAYTALELAKILKRDQTTILRHTAKLMRWDQIEVVDERIKAVKIGNPRPDGKRNIAPRRSRVFKTTKRGRARLDKKGGHTVLCPECMNRKK